LAWLEGRLRHLALNAAKQEPSKGSMRGKLKRAGWDQAFLAGLLSVFNRVEVAIALPCH
jgi:hypothetical protein